MQMKILLVVVVFITLVADMRAQNHIRGEVLEDSNGDKVGGVTIMVKGLDICSETDSLGRYKITVPDEKSVLLFTKPGYMSMSTRSKRYYEINVVLANDDDGRGEVEVGYGSQRASEVTGAVSSISSSRAMRCSVISSTKKMKKGR